MARGRGRGRAKRGKPANQGSRPSSPPQPCAQNVEDNSGSDEMLAQVLRLSQQECENSEILRNKENEDFQRAMNESQQECEKSEILTKKENEDLERAMNERL